MTNYEYYKDGIIELIISNRALAVDKLTRKPVACAVLDCNYCKFNNEKIRCEQRRKEWLKGEYVEVPKLTKKERLLCELIGEGYIIYAPAPDVSFFVWSDKNVSFNPMKKLFYMKDEEGDITFTGHRIRRFDSIANVDFDEMFNFIKESKRAWSIEELLKLEVIDE